MSFGELDDKQLKRFAQKVGSEVKAKTMVKKAEYRMNVIGAYALREIKKTSPHDTGNLRDSWMKSGVKYSDHAIVVELSNDREYASFVEYGHRTRSGGYVPARHTVRDSLKATEENKLNKTTQQELDGYLSKLLGD